MDDWLGIDWEDLASTAMAHDARRRGVDILNRMYDNDPDDFAAWLKSVEPDEHMSMILALLTVAEFLVEANANTMSTSAEMLIACLKDVAENS